MTMNTRQAGAFTEAIKKEERSVQGQHAQSSGTGKAAAGACRNDRRLTCLHCFAFVMQFSSRERWNETHGAAYAARAAQRAATQAARAATLAAANGTNGLSVNGFGASTGRSQQNGLPTLGHSASMGVFGSSFGGSQSARVDGSSNGLVELEGGLPRTVQRRVLKTVEVPAGTRAVRVPVGGNRFRVDTVPHSKLVEVEVLHSYKLEAVPLDETPRVAATRDLPGTERPVRGKLNRTIGRETYDAQDPYIASLPIDDEAVSARGQQQESPSYRAAASPQLGSSQSAHSFGFTGRPYSARDNARSSARGNARGSPRVLGNGYYAGQSARLQATAGLPYYAGYQPASARPLYNPGALQSRAAPVRLGFKVRSSSTSSMAPGTCTVVEIEAGQSAARAGLRPGDVILSTNGQRTASLGDFRHTVANSRGPILLQVRRGSDRFVVTLHR
jgi:hypothetical protein